MDTTYTNLRDLVSLVEPEENRKALLQMLRSYSPQIKTFPASIKYHHSYTGGWKDHTEEVIGIALDLRLNLGVGGLTTASDIVLSGILHDFAKLVTYKTDPNHQPLVFDKIDRRWSQMSPEVWTFQQCAHFGVKLSDEVVNAILFAEGGWSEDARTTSRYGARTGGPLAALLHAGDLLSATFVLRAPKCNDAAKGVLPEVA